MKAAKRDKLKVLLADDEPFIMEGLKILIDWESEGYEIAGTFANGEQVLEYLKSAEADLIISDIKMPGMDGLELLARIREMGLTRVQFILLSGYEDFSFAQQAIRHGCIGYILKPMEAKELTALLRKVRSLAVPESGREAFRREALIPAVSRAILLKEELDALLSAIGAEEQGGILDAVHMLFEKMGSAGGEAVDSRMMNIHYLMVQLVQLADPKDEDGKDQHEILQFISSHGMQEAFLQENGAKAAAFALEYAKYLTGRRAQEPSGVLQEIEQEIREHYADNLTLRDLGKKYFINSSYLGQIFQKHYGKSFKDYLAQVRIRKAAELLLGTQEKVGWIGAQVGYRDTDYFVRKFIEIMDCTPYRYRKCGGRIDGNF